MCSCPAALITPPFIELWDLRVTLILIPALLMDIWQARAGEERFFIHWPRLVQAGGLAVLLILLIFGAVSPELGPTFVYQGF